MLELVVVKVIPMVRIHTEQVAVVLVVVVETFNKTITIKLKVVDLVVVQ